MTLTIRVGSSRQQESLVPCPINKDSNPVFISSEHFDGYITVRILDHQPSSPSQGRFKATNPASEDGFWDADSVLFIAEVEGKIHVPIGTSIATAFARTIDPSFIANGIWDSKRPWVGSPLVSGMNVLRVWPRNTSSDTLMTKDRRPNHKKGCGFKSKVDHNSKNCQARAGVEAERREEDLKNGVGPIDGGWSIPSTM
ncbi:hypothetical protein FBU30_005114 [Linnemannia zychae]|nr:hypothetical protein FBU30_005114 [Linnemannia zychae]